ncbi:Crp/Fnr family transcriptional regulator [Chitinophaga pinensis]|uniref:Transcriptional regulator, Crp/Fnr family n=1 Tax=Chitinophaga pinensis (strain ATCC 43595 / DSM 2588 / LMG 13176 / NBRC 15968 / NCIMB 11800 / UQM 2034) TaxID=485918 RepID=A0A979FZ26_CHIPD|nr:Crp/Fnr family transcriptional regulator [Chitinophaga pinensis]ACU57760.1 putative transcriptional regulator, Crp/Fnr family [Chitinophaga pinensis DSM 2588]
MKKKTTLLSGNDIHPPISCTPFLEYLSKDIVLDDATKKLVEENCRLVKYGEGKRLLETGHICQYIYFIIEGKCVSYFTDFKGKTITWFFHFNSAESSAKNVFAVDYRSFLSREPSTLTIDTLVPITAIRFSADALETLISESPAIERWLRLLTEKAFIQVYDRINTLLTLPAPDRYKKFLQEEPYLLNMFSNYLVATYLNVTPQSFSRIRKRLSRD